MSIAESFVRESLPEGVFGIKVDYQRGTTRPARVFQAMTDLIEAVEQLDRDLAWSVNTAIEYELVLQEIQVSSLLTYLKGKVRPKKDTPRLENAEISCVVRFVGRATKAVLGYTSAKNTLNGRDDVQALKVDLNKIAREELSPVDHLRFHPLSDRQIVGNLSQIGESLAHLRASDNVSFISNSGDEVPINTEFRVSQEAVDKLLTQRTYTNNARMILKVKKPDYLGDSRWELRYQRQSLDARIQDEAWLQKFRTRGAPVLPGDALDADVLTTAHYGYDGEVINTVYDVVKVHDVIEGQKDGVQSELLEENSTS